LEKIMKKSALVLTLTMLLTSRALSDTITVADGTVYKDAIITKHDAVNATILYSDGGVTLPIATLPVALQIKLGYKESDAKAQLVAECLEDHSDEIDKTLKLKAIKTTGNIVQVLPDGVLANLFLTEPPPGEPRSFEISYPIGKGTTCYLICDSVGLVDGGTWSGVVWKIGTYSYKGTDGATRTVEKYTSSRAIAAEALCPP
jgi:hypothetical protein